MIYYLYVLLLGDGFKRRLGTNNNANEAPLNSLLLLNFGLEASLDNM
jgi:hypothetical protein